MMGFMLGPLITTKIHIPPVRPDLVPRPQLLRLLDSALDRPHGLILVSAPAGFGKTTLVSEWLGRLKLPAAWISLDKDDNEPARFWRYMIAALQTVDPGLGRAAQAALEAPQFPPQEGLIASILNDLVVAEHSLILVLDDYHVIEIPSIHAGLSYLLDHMPPALRIVITTRSDPPLAISRRRGRAQVTETRTADLRFTHAETAAFLNSVHQLNLPDEDVTCLENRTEGWIVGLQLAAISLHRQADRHAYVAAFAGDDRYVVDYLLEEVLGQQTPALQSFLLQTSILERLCGPLCEAVTGMPEAQDILHRLEEANLFIVPLDNRRYWYRYHTLFADLLRRRLGRDSDGGTRLDLYRRGSLWHEQEGLFPEAISLAFSASDFSFAADLLERHVLSIFFRSETLRVHKWLQTLPESVLKTRPLLCAMYANTIAHASGNQPALLKTAAVWLQAAEKALASSHGEDPISRAGSPEEEKIRGLVGLTRAYMALWQGKAPQTVIPLARQALDDLPPADSPSADPDLLRFRSGLYNNLGMSYLALGDEEAAIRAFVEARSVGELCGDLLNVFAAVSRQAECLRRKGRLPEAFAFCREAMQSHGGGDGGDGSSIPYAGFVYICMGQILLEWNDLDAAESALARGVSLSSLSAAPFMKVFGNLALARLQQARGDFPAARETLDRLEGAAPAAKSQVAAHRVRLCLRQGLSEPALTWAQGRKLAGDPEESLTLARIILHLRRPGASRKVTASLPGMDSLGPFLEKELRAAEDAGWIDRMIELCILRAQAADTQNDSAGAESALRKALSLSQAGGYIRVYIDEGQSVLRILKALENDNGETGAYIRRILAAGAASGEARPSGSSSRELYEQLSARELEVLRLLAVGLPNAEIARRLVITLNTTKKHITHIFGKLGVANRTEAVARARSLGLLK
jgi:LuxR family maltose regulon positive regulatory protein